MPKKRNIPEVYGNLAMKVEQKAEVYSSAERSMCYTFLANAKANGFNDRKFALLPVSLLHIDQTYQRELDKAHVSEMSKNWDPDFCDDLVVSFRDGDDGFGFFVLDGQHRLEVARLKGINMLPCVIYEGMSVEDEAKKFGEQDCRRKKLNNFDQFKCRAVWRHEDTIIVKRVCDEYNVSYSKSNKSTKPLLSAINAAILSCRKHGEEGVRWIFDTIQKLGWHNDCNAYSRAVINALSNVYGMHEDKLETKLQLIRNLQGRLHNPCAIVTRAQAERPGRGPTVALTQFMETLISI